MAENHDIFLRAHTVVLSKPIQTDSAEATPKKRGRLHVPSKAAKWPDEVLVFDCESRIDTGQQLTFGFYRVLKLQGDTYELAEEGAFFDDDLPTDERAVLEAYTADVDPKRFTLVAPFESDQQKWAGLECINISSPPDGRKYELTTSFMSPQYGEKAVVDTFENLLQRYIRHPEAKSLAPDGSPSKPETRGLLQRAHIVAGKHLRIGKECDRYWEEGDTLEALTFAPIEYGSAGPSELRDGYVVASQRLIRKIRKVGIRKLVRLGFGRRILEKICRREPVRYATLREYEEFILEYEL